MMMNDIWAGFLRSILLARNYGKPFEIAQNPWRGREHEVLPAPENPILEALLPGLLYVQLASLLDEFLGDAAASLGVVVGGRDHLHDRIEALGSRISNATALHAIRVRRRALAHDGQAVCTWEELESAVDEVQRALKDLGLVDPRPDYRIDMTWDLEQFDPPRVFDRGPGWRIDLSAVRSYTVGVKLADEWVQKYDWKIAETITSPD